MGGNKHPTCMLPKKTHTQDLDPSFPVSNSNCTDAFFLCGFFVFERILLKQRMQHCQLRRDLHEVQIRPDSYKIRTFFGYLFDTVLFYDDIVTSIVFCLQTSQKWDVYNKGIIKCLIDPFLQLTKKTKKYPTVIHHPFWICTMKASW